MKVWQVMLVFRFLDLHESVLCYNELTVWQTMLFFCFLHLHECKLCYNELNCVL